MTLATAFYRDHDFIQALYLLAVILFVVGLRGLMLLTNLTILVLAGFVGFYVISKVPNTLHTPLMSGTNAIHGIVLLGGILVISSAVGAFNKVILFIAIVFGTINIVGGFLVTDRMLGMFKGGAGGRKPAGSKAEPEKTP